MDMKFGMHIFHQGVYQPDSRLKKVKKLEKSEVPVIQPDRICISKRLVQYALQFQGVPYVWGGYSPSGFDCSGFVSYCLTNSGVLNTGHLDCNGLLARMTVIPESEMQPGDIIFFQGTYATSGASHVGIYIGNGQMVHSGNPNKISDIYSSYFQQHWMCVARW